MRRVLVVSLLLNVALGLGLCWNALVANAGAGGKAPVGNGDVNGDGLIDISDGVYILSWLFTGGNAPLPIECPPPAGRALPSTGQTKCYGDLEGQVIEVPCESAGCSGQDGFYSTGCSAEGRFLDNGDGTVTDNCTTLMWQKDQGQLLPWCEALAYCEDLSFAGHDDWRLPNLRELQSIVDYGRFSPAIDPVFSAVSSVYWSSTSDAEAPAHAWGVGFYDGYVTSGFGGAGKGIGLHVRAVRNGP